MLMMVATLLLSLFPIVLLVGMFIRLLKGDVTSYYFRRVALSIDRLGGTVLFNTQFHTISANVGKWDTENPGIVSTILRSLIDALFYEGHCKDNYTTEYKGGM